MNAAAREAELPSFIRTSNAENLSLVATLNKKWTKKMF